MSGSYTCPRCTHTGQIEQLNCRNCKKRRTMHSKEDGTNRLRCSHCESEQICSCPKCEAEVTAKFIKLPVDIEATGLGLFYIFLAIGAILVIVDKLF
ncbi:SF2_C_priA domain containing protein [Oxalobacteraceae bacterium]